MSKERESLGLKLAGLVGEILAAFVRAGLFWWLWNDWSPDTFQVPHIGYLDCVMVVVLVGFLTNGRG